MAPYLLQQRISSRRLQPVDPSALGTRLPHTAYTLSDPSRILRTSLLPNYPSGVVKAFVDYPYSLERIVQLVLTDQLYDEGSVCIVRMLAVLQRNDGIEKLLTR